MRKKSLQIQAKSPHIYSLISTVAGIVRLLFLCFGDKAAGFSATWRCQGSPPDVSGQRGTRSYHRTSQGIRDIGWQQRRRKHQSREKASSHTEVRDQAIAAKERSVIITIWLCVSVYQLTKAWGGGEGDVQGQQGGKRLRSLSRFCPRIRPLYYTPLLLSLQPSKQYCKVISSFLRTAVYNILRTYDFHQGA